MDTTDLEIIKAKIESIRNFYSKRGLAAWGVLNYLDYAEDNIRIAIAAVKKLEEKNEPETSPK